MSNPLRKIKDCQYCQQVIQNRLKDCKNWEVKKKEAYQKIQEENCLTEQDKLNIASYGEPYCQYTIEKVIEKYQTPPAKLGIISVSCDKGCGEMITEDNGFGDSNKNHSCQSQPNKSPNNNKNNDQEKENILAYFKKNNIQSIKIKGDKLIIKYNHKEEEEEELNTTELQQTKSYLQKIGKNELSLSDLEQRNNNSNSPDKSNKGLYIGLAVVGVLVVIFVVWLVIKNNKKQ